MKPLKLAAASCLLPALWLTSGCDQQPAKTSPKHAIISYPTTIDSACRDGKAKIYDECGDQFALYKTALARAVAEDKILLVSYGAEWCIWCHVFEDYINGESSAFTHTYSDEDDKKRYTSTLYEREDYDVSQEAIDLATMVADKFVILKLEYKYSFGSDDALQASGADILYDYSLPFIYTVSHKGDVAKALNSNKVQTRRDTLDWFRGYNRKQLKAELISMAEAAR